MKKILTPIACLLALSAAHATHCNNGLPDSYYPKCILPTTTPAQPAAAPTSFTNTNQQVETHATAAANVRVRTTAAGGSARQQQTQGQANRQTNAQTVSSNGAGQGAGAGSGIVTFEGDQAGSGDRFLSVALPGVPPAIAPTMVGGAVSTTAMHCGPAQRIEAQPIYGTQFGLFKDTQVLLGATEITKPYLDEDGQEAIYIPYNGRWFGHEVLYSTAVLGVTGATSVGFGGFGSNGGGNAAGGISGGMQRMVTTIQLRLCQIPPAIPSVRIVRAEIPHRRVVTVKPRRVTAKVCECRQGQ